MNDTFNNKNMKQTTGYIYIRKHPAYDIYNACKLGKASNIPERDTQYATGEIKRGYFDVIFEVPLEIMSILERLLQHEFQEYNINYDAGTEFYNQTIITMIEPYLSKMKIQYKKLSKEEIDNLVRCNRVKKLMEKINIHELIKQLKSKITKKKQYDKIKNSGCDKNIKEREKNTNVDNKKETNEENKKETMDERNKCNISYKPRKEQSIIIEKSITYFTEKDKGLLVLMCGVGKTLISLWITQGLKLNKIVIGVPNKLLLKQWSEVVSIIFQSIPCFVVSGGVDIENITQFLIKNQKKCIVITTYSSSHKVYTATSNTGFIFDMKINDECHHLTTNNMRMSHTTKKYIQMLHIPSKKQLSLTATLKQLDCDCQDDNIVSNDNIDYFGEIIDRKCLLWAIDKNIVCDYAIQSIVTDEEKIEDHLIKFHITKENDKRLFLSAFATLKSIVNGHSHHLLIYSNNKENSLKLVQYIKALLENEYFDIHELYYSNYHSEMTSNKQKEIIYNFKKSSFGIITCVYCLGEGWDFPLLDGVVFAENMSSNIRIVQSALRASRKNKNDISKLTKIILPVLNTDEWIERNENTDLKKVKEVIYQMGLEDNTIEQKIKVYKMNIKKEKLKNCGCICKNNDDLYEFAEYDEELTNKLRLKTVRRITLSTTYEKAKKIIVEKKINCKQDYYKLCKKDNRLPENPEAVFKGNFTNWIDYLSIERKYYDMETCRKKIVEYLIKYPELKCDDLNYTFIKNELCKLDVNFPPNDLWVEYYNVKNLQEIITIPKNKKKKQNILL